VRGASAGILLAGVLASCSLEVPEAPQRDCSVVIWARSSSGAAPRVVGSWQGWATPGEAMTEAQDGWWALRVEPPPGEHGYLIVDGGVARIDDHNPLTTFRVGEGVNDGREVSRLWIEDCAAPKLSIDAVALEGGRLEILASFWAGERQGEAAALDPASVASTPAQLSVEAASPGGEPGEIALVGEGLARGRHGFEISASDVAGEEAGARVSIFVDPVAPSWEDAIVYQVMIDRFYADGGLPLEPPPSPGARAGGTLGGVEAALERGDFEALGVSALWLSPVYQNPEEAREGTDGRLYEGYHGYWVERGREVEDHIGGEPALRSLIAAAHARGIAVIFDVVPNHVYETHEIVAAHRDEGWFNEHPDECVCGTPSCPWSGFMQDCWFAPYLPDLRLEHPAAMDWAVGELLWWLDTYEADGLRIDAVPMMPRAASRRIAHEVRRHTAPGDDLLLLGEVFTGPGTPGVAGLRRYLGPAGLDSVFDFPTMWAIRDVLASESAGFTTLDALLAYIEAELAGSGAVLGRMLGNHDVVRFTSAVVGDGGGDPWTSPASQPEGESPEELAWLQRVALGLTLQLTLPGMPVLYYGDEIALAGASDPDNRRVMPELTALSPARAALLEHARTLGTLRRCSPALRRGLRQTLHAGEDTYAYARLNEEEGGAAVVVVLSRADEPRTIPLPGTTPLTGRVRDVLSGVTLDLDEAGSVELGPRSALVLLPEDDPCVP
jgi:glycosidase